MYKCYNLIDHRSKFKFTVSEIVDKFSGYINIDGYIVSFSRMNDTTIILHAGTDKFVEFAIRVMNDISVKEYIENDWLAFSMAKKSFLLMENRHNYKIWIYD